MVQLISALDLLHSNKIFHRDITLKNILVDSDAFDQIVVKFTDFGISVVEKIG